MRSEADISKCVTVEDVKCLPGQGDELVMQTKSRCAVFEEVHESIPQQ